MLLVKKQQKQSAKKLKSEKNKKKRLADSFNKAKHTTAKVTVHTTETKDNLILAHGRRGGTEMTPLLEIMILVITNHITEMKTKKQNLLLMIQVALQGAHGKSGETKKKIKEKKQTK